MAMISRYSSVAISSAGQVQVYAESTNGSPSISAGMCQPCSNRVAA
jgi:hypothetical protein